MLSSADGFYGHSHKNGPNNRYEQFGFGKVAEGFNMQAFRLDLEHKNYHDGLVTDEGVLSQLKLFVGEYLTNLHEFRYEYRFNEHGQLINSAWNVPAMDLLLNAVNEPGIDAQTKQIREAELGSFRTIEQLMKQTVELHQELGPLAKFAGYTKAILQSPKENYPGSEHSFVSFYGIIPEYTRRFDGQQILEYKVQVRNRRIYNCGYEKHNAVRETWETKIDGTFQPEELSPVELLANAILVPEDMTFEELVQDYGPFAYIPKYDINIQAQLEDFSPEIETFFQIFKSIKPGDFETKKNDLIESFKIMLIKAKVHFNEQEAREKWPWPEMVDQIKSSIQTKAKLKQMEYTFGMSQAFKNQILALPILINGSCGSAGDSGNYSITVGGASIAELTQSLYTFVIPGRKSSERSILRPDETTCSCGCKWFIENGNRSTYEYQCPHCGANKNCSTANVAIPILVNTEEKVNKDGVY